MRLPCIFRREPDFIIGGNDDPYLLRWYVIPRNRWFNIYLHKFLRDDDDRALHDHPWWSLALILKGSYTQRLPGGKAVHRKPGRLVLRRPEHAHRVELLRRCPVRIENGGFHCGDTTLVPAWTLFITGPRLRKWGFHCPNGWRHWEEFTSPADKGQVGRGCESRPNRKPCATCRSPHTARWLACGCRRRICR